MKGKTKLQSHQILGLLCVGTMIVGGLAVALLVIMGNYEENEAYLNRELAEKEYRYLLYDLDGALFKAKNHKLSDHDLRIQAILATADGRVTVREKAQIAIEMSRIDQQVTQIKKARAAGELWECAVGKCPTP